MVTNSLETNDLFWIAPATMQSFLPVVQAGAQLVMAQITPQAKGHVHAKVAVVDERFLLIGSWNAWLRSHFYETEVCLLLDSPHFAKFVVQAVDELQESPAYRKWNEA